MQYKELIQFEPIDSIIELQEANDTDIAKQLVQTFVLSEDMAEKLVKVAIPHLQFQEPIDNKELPEPLDQDFLQAMQEVLSGLSKVEVSLDNLRQALRSEERRVGKECVSTCRS